MSSGIPVTSDKPIRQFFWRTVCCYKTFTLMMSEDARAWFGALSLVTVIMITTIYLVVLITTEISLCFQGDWL